MPYNNLEHDGNEDFGELGVGSRQIKIVSLPSSGTKQKVIEQVKENLQKRYLSPFNDDLYEDY